MHNWFKDFGNVKWEDTNGWFLPSAAVSRSVYNGDTLSSFLVCERISVHLIVLREGLTIKFIWVGRWGIHYGQTRIQPLRFGTEGFLMDSFICYQDKAFL